MPLENLKTDLKSLKYGKDRFDGGDSGQPYIKKDIDSAEASNPSATLANKDFLLRGGISAPIAAVKDGERLARYFFDLKSPSGFLFIAKQNLLSQTGVSTQTKTNPNEGVYTPLTTLAQSVGSFAGTHFYKQGLNPLEGVETYTDIIKTTVKGGNDGKNNRLVQLFDTKILNKSKEELKITPLTNPNKISTTPTDLLSYGGGPGSILGIGKTDIKAASERTGRNNPNLENSLGKFFKPPPQEKTLEQQINEDGFDSENEDGDKVKANTEENVKKSLKTGFAIFEKPPITPSPNGLSSLASLIKDNTSTVSTKFANTFGRGNISNLYTGLNPTSTNISLVENSTVYPNFTNINPSFTQKEGNRIYDNKTVTYTQSQILEQIPKTPNKENPGSFQQDFRTEIIDNPNSKIIMGVAPSYSGPNSKAIEGKSDSRVKQISPGQRGDRINYQKGKIIDDGVSVVDRINFQPIYESGKVRSTKDGVAKNDFVKFRIAALNKNNPSLKQFIHFRAFINSFSDSYGAKWTGQSFMGRGEEFYKYGGFSRDISIGFTVAAQSKPELMAQYKKLNFLASNLAPTYSSKGYMGGPLVQLTMGGWCFELPGFIGSLGLGVPQESPWEIAIPATDDGGDPNNPIFSDPTVKEMPHIVNVDMKFTPIHTFRPEKQKLTFGEDGNEVATYGPQRYIQLTNGINNNYVPVSLAQSQEGIGGGPEKKQYQSN